jgi:hypothetical protein
VNIVLYDRQMANPMSDQRQTDLYKGNANLQTLKMMGLFQ